jgi:DNA primase
MAGRIPQRFIDDLLERIDIVEVIDSRVKLRKTGRNFTACCPFHDEKTPSFSVNPDKQFYYCFGCGAGGNALGFIMDYERMEFPEAVESLASLAGLEVPREETSPEQQQQAARRKDIYTLLEQAAAWYRKQLREHPNAQEATTYLRSRGLSGDIASRFGIGYAPPGWDNLLKELGSDDEHRELLIESGMLISKEDGRVYDRFRHRIMFPIKDNRGRIIAFGGRVLDDDKPKYLNSPETGIFSKGSELYGLYEARKANSHLPRLLIVEGYMDVVALAQHDIPYAAATLGTATSQQHLEKVFRHTDELVFCFDGDDAGRTAAQRALETSLPTMQDGRQIRFMFLPEGEDPDSLVRNIGTEQFKHLVDKASPLSEFLFDSLATGLDLATPEGQSRLSKLAVPLLAKIPAGVFKQRMLDMLADRTGMDRKLLSAAISTAPPPITPPTQDQAPPPEYGEYNNYNAESDINRPDILPASPLLATHSPVQRAIALLTLQPKLAQQIETVVLPDGGEAEENQLLIKLVELVKKEPDTNTPRLLGRYHGQPEGKLITRLLNHDTLPDEPGIQEHEFMDIIKHLRDRASHHQHSAIARELEKIPFAEMTVEQKQQYRLLVSSKHRK